MIKNLFKRNRMLIQMVLSLLLMLCLPLVLLNWYTAKNSYTAAKQQNEERQMQNAEYFSSYFYTQYQKMLRCSLNAFADRYILGRAQQNMTYANEAMEKVQTYQLSVPVSYDCYVFLPNCDYVVGGAYCLRKSMLGNRFSSDAEGFGQTLMSFLESPQEEKVHYMRIPSPQKAYTEGMLVILSAVGRSGQTVNIIYSVTPQSLTNAFLGQIGSEDYGLYIFGSDGEPLCSNRSGIPESLEALTESWGGEFGEFVSDIQCKRVDIEVDGEMMSFFREYSPELGLSFVISVPQLTADEPVYEIYRSISIMLILTMAVLMVMIALVVYINYHPIRKLVRQAGEDSREAMDEISSLMQALDERERVSLEVEEQRRQLTDYILISLLDGKRVPRAELEKIGIPPSFDSFFVLCSRSGEDISGWSELEGMLWEEYSCRCYRCRAKPLEGRCSVYMCAMAECDAGLRRQIAETIHARTGGCIGVGSMEKTEQRVQYSYFSALSAIEQCPENGIAYYEDSIRSFNYIENYPAQEMMGFLMCLKKGDADGAGEWFSRTLAQVRENCHSMLMEQYIRFDILSSFCKSVTQMGILLPQIEIQELLAAETPQMAEKMGELIDTVCRELEGKRVRMEKDTVKLVRDYIEEQYADINLSQQMLADRLNMSFSAFGVFFGNAFGMPFRKYLSDLRIERSKKLLEETELNVKDICTGVGMTDPSYFTKIFKKSTGITPAQYREQSRMLG